MGKSTELGKLANIWLIEQYAISYKTLSATSGPYSPKWKRIVSRQRGKVNTGARYKNRAYKVARKLSELQFWSQVIRRNRKLSGLPPQVFRFGNSGRAIQ